MHEEDEILELQAMFAQLEVHDLDATRIAATRAEAYRELEGAGNPQLSEVYNRFVEPGLAVTWAVAVLLWAAAGASILLTG